MNDDCTAVSIEELSDREALCIERRIRRTVGIHQQNGQVTAVIPMDVCIQIEVRAGRGERRGALADCMHVEPVEAWREAMDAYLDDHITTPFLSEPHSAHRGSGRVMKLRFRVRMVRPCRSTQRR
jgi:hypothetical protein